MSSHFNLLCLFFVCLLSHAWALQAKFELLEEWNAWKGFHKKTYSSTREEVEKHVVWLSNKEYVDQHNANAHIFGFTLNLNHLGDMVGRGCLCPLHTFFSS